MKQETIEEAAERLQKDKYGVFISKNADVKGQAVIDTAKSAFLSGMKEGTKWQAKRMYSEKEVIAIVEKSRETGLTAEYLLLTEKFKKK